MDGNQVREELINEIPESIPPNYFADHFLHDRMCTQAWSNH